GDRQYRIVDVKKNGDEVLHYAEGQVDAKPGDAAHGQIDWDRRYALMRHHTAIHLLDGVVERNYKNGTITGGSIFPEKARIDFEMDGLNRELLQKILDDTNAIAQEGHRVFARQLTKEEALAIPNLARTEPGREMMKAMESVRVVEIEGVDMQMDGGLHVADTKEIGKMTLSKYENKGKHSKRAEIVLGQSQ
ncbi:MAG: alanyl-tRNA editing protein, partial [Candidatus Marsarchaeota archaeon]|nr:alanyl-tRNA editing protein [Candidatus Marsarchaeota archaeon]